MRTVRTMSYNRFYMLLVNDAKHLLAQWIAAGFSRSARSLRCLATNYSYTETTQLFEAGLESISNKPIRKHPSCPLTIFKSFIQMLFYDARVFCPIS
jgi:hypothetical protein